MIEYCLVALNNIDGLREEINEISIVKPSFIESKSVLVARFESKLSPFNLNKIFNTGNGRTFFIFELTPITSTVHIDIPKLHTALFSDFDKKAEYLSNSMDKMKGKGEADVISGMFKNLLGISDMFDLSTDLNPLNSPIMYSNFKFNTTNDNVEDEAEAEIEYDEEYLSLLSKDDKEKLINELLAKGANLTTKDKETLSFLAKGK